MTRPDLKAALLHLADECGADGQKGEQALLILVAACIGANLTRQFMESIGPMMRAGLKEWDKRHKKVAD